MKRVYMFEYLPAASDRPCGKAPAYRTALTYRKADILRWAKALRSKGNYNYSAYSLSYSYFKDCHFCMDAPTFRVVGNPLAI